jgi:hypothetical protein
MSNNKLLKTFSSSKCITFNSTKYKGDIKKKLLKSNIVQQLIAKELFVKKLYKKGFDY